MNVDLNAASITQLIVAVLLPALVALVTKENEPARLKALLFLLALSVLTAIGQSVYQDLENHQKIVVGALIYYFLVTYGTGALAYFGLYKPTGVDAALKAKVRVGAKEVSPDWTESLRQLNAKIDTLSTGLKAFGLQLESTAKSLDARISALESAPVAVVTPVTPRPVKKAAPAKRAGAKAAPAKRVAPKK